MLFAFTLKFPDFLYEKKPLSVYFSLCVSSTFSISSSDNSAAKFGFISLGVIPLLVTFIFEVVRDN
jgi:hypothetical protein